MRMLELRVSLRKNKQTYKIAVIISLILMLTKTMFQKDYYSHLSPGNLSL